MNTFPVLAEICRLVITKNPMHGNMIKELLTECDPEFLEAADVYLGTYLCSLYGDRPDLDNIVDAYLIFVSNVFKEEIRFRRTGNYRYARFQEVNESVYSNPHYMTRHIIGLALSQILWPNHRKMYLFFKERIKKERGNDYLEVGPGHGLFLAEALRVGSFDRYRAVDVSETSISLCRSLLTNFSRAAHFDLKFEVMDICDYTESGRYDFVTFGEVMEHLEDPSTIVRKIYDLLRPHGGMYLSTCCNCPVIDHIFLFKDVDEIRRVFHETGFLIQEELVLPYGNLSVDEALEKKLAVNYCAWLSRL